MKRPIVPRHEDEVIAAGIRRRHGDRDKLSTSTLDRVDFDGVSIVSRYSKAEELDAVIKALTRLSDELRQMVDSVYVDSKAGCTYSVEVKSGVELIAMKVLGDHLAAAFVHICGGFNGIYITGDDGLEVSVDPDWGEGAAVG